MMVYKYSLHDPDSGKVLYEGTAADLAAQGVVRAEKILPTLWRDQQRQHKRRGKHRWDITREKVEVACSGKPTRRGCSRKRRRTPRQSRRSDRQSRK